MNGNRFATYRKARAAYQERGVVVSRRKPWSRRSRMLAGTALAGLLGAAALFVSPPALAVPVDHTPQVLAAAGAWSFYNEAKKYLMSGDIDLNTSSFRMSLHTSATNAATNTLSVYGSVNNEVAEANGYSSSGKPLTVTWTVGASASEYRFSFSDVIWTASAGTIPNIKYAVVWITGASAGARKLVCRSALSTAQFTVTTGNTLTVSPSANGMFELN